MAGKAIIPKIGKNLRFKYSNLFDEKCKEAMREDYIVEGFRCQQLYEKYKRLVAKPFTEASLGVILTKWGWPEIRRMMRVQVKDELDRNKIRQSDMMKRMIAKPKGETKLAMEHRAAQALANRTKDRMVKGADKHFDRMEVLIDRAHEVIEKKVPENATISEHLDDLTKFDKLGRTLYRMDEQKPINNHQLNVAMLIGIGDQLTDPYGERDVTPPTSLPLVEQGDEDAPD